ncbi:hypothetical protein DFH11DRAFT_1170417 [Phellopilus nigrolimitatus]|nr:hypothetical protein DFH11DRAFT_1170417 [Phellopilus nigrolimitatus]
MPIRRPRPSTSSSLSSVPYSYADPAAPLLSPASPSLSFMSSPPGSPGARRKPYSPLSAFESVPSAPPAPVAVAASASARFAPELQTQSQLQPQRRSTLSFEIGGGGSEADTDTDRSSEAHARAHAPPPPPSAHDFGVVDEIEEEEEARELAPPRPRFLADSAARASWSSQDSSLYAPSDATDSEAAKGYASEGADEEHRINPTPSQSRAPSQKQKQRKTSSASAGRTATGLPPGAAPPRPAPYAYPQPPQARAPSPGTGSASDIAERPPRARAPPSAFRTQGRNSFTGPPGAVADSLADAAENGGIGAGDGGSSAGHGSASAYSPLSPLSPGSANGNSNINAYPGYPYPGQGYAYPPSSPGSPSSAPGQAYLPYPYPYPPPGSVSSVAGSANGSANGGGSGVATPRPHNAFMASSAMARASAADLVPYAARINGMNAVATGGTGGGSRRNSVDVGFSPFALEDNQQFAPPNPPFAGHGYSSTSSAPGYPVPYSPYPPPPPRPHTPGTPSTPVGAGAGAGDLPGLRHAGGSAARLREPFLSPASRRSSSVWAPPTPLLYSAVAPGERAASGFFQVGGNGSALHLALPGKKEPLPSSALQRKISMSEKPWVTQKEKWEGAAWWVTFCIMWVGVAVGAVLCFFGFRGVQKIEQNLCSVLDDDFSTFDTNTWHADVELGGFGNGEFQMTTDTSENLYIKNGQLYIMPTLTSDEIGAAAIFDGHTYNLSGCTSTNVSACSVTSRASSGTVINPVKSARISTQNSSGITFGRVDVRAKLPVGDWLWPAIWMLPTDSKYGPWPLSGEIDIMEARGNLPSYPAQGDNFVRSSLNWGPLASVTARAFGWQSQKRTTYAADFHVYSFEWTGSFMRFSVDSQLNAMLDLSLAKTSFFERGGFPQTAQNGSTEAVVTNIWEGQGNAAPFDQEFYLIIDLAVGGTSGWFPDKQGGKMWFDGSDTAMTDFASAQSTWSPTWPTSDDDRAFRIDYVKMWKTC